MDKMNAGLVALTTESEQAEIKVVGKPPIRLRYHKGSERTGRSYGIDCRLWDVLSPKLANYVYNSDSHVPTLSVEGLRQVGLIGGTHGDC